jgi:hypothetical protein
MDMKEYLNKDAGVPEWGLPEYADEAPVADVHRSCGATGFDESSAILL